MDSRKSELQQEVLLTQLDAMLRLPAMESDPSHQVTVIFGLSSAYKFTSPTPTPRALEYMEEILRRVERISSRQELVKLIQMGAPNCLEFLKIPANRQEPPRTPEDELFDRIPRSNWIRRCMDWMRTGRAPTGFYFWASVAALSASCHKRVYAIDTGHRLWMNLYIVVSTSHGGGKGAASKPMLQLIKHLNKRIDDEFSISSVNHDVDARLRNKYIELIPSDSTPEAVNKRLNRRQYSVTPTLTDGAEGEPQTLHCQKLDASGLLYLDEMATFFGRDKFANSARYVWATQLFEEDDYGKDTSGEGEQILENLAMSIYAQAAEGWFSKIIEREMVEGGFMDRCIWVHRELDKDLAGGKFQLAPRDPLEMDALVQWLIDCVPNFPWETEVQISPEACQVIEAWRQQLLERTTRNIERYGVDESPYSFNRHAALVTKVACLLALGDRKTGALHEPTVVTLDHATLARDIMRKEYDGIETIFEKARKSEYDAVLYSMVDYAERKGGCVPRTDMFTKFKNRGRGKGPAGFKELIETLEQQGRASVELGPYTGGRRREYFRTTKHRDVEGGCERCGRVPGTPDV